MGINLRKDIVATIFSKSLILLMNFAVVVMTTHFWGDAGRGSIAIFVADLSMINIFANVFTGSSVSYFFSRMGNSKIATSAYLWSFVVAAIGGLVLLAAGQLRIAPFVFIAATLMGLVTFNNSLFIGDQKIGHYNLITILQPTLLIVFMIIFKLAFPNLDYFCYFFGQVCSLIILLLICRVLRHKNGIHDKWDLDLRATKEILSFGWKTELSNLLQFVNYRLTYYLLDFYIGRGSVGVFSIGVTLAEAIWIVSRSMSMVQFSNVLKTGDTSSTRKETTKIAFLSLVISALCVIVVISLPKELFAIIFGEEFSNVGHLVMLLSPGILAIAFSNVLGNFLSATRQLNILIIKSAVGVVFTVVLSVILIPRIQIDGACIVNSVSYVVSSIVIIFFYYLRKKEKYNS